MAIPIDVVEDPDLTALETTLRALLKPYRYFHVDITGKYVNLAEEKITGLPVTNFGYIKKIQRHLNEYMRLNNFKVTEEREGEQDFIISMSQERIPKELENSANLFDQAENRKAFLVDRIELWKSLNAKKESIVFSINLKNPNII